MSSFATAVSRSPEKETDLSGEQADLLAAPGAAPEIEAPPHVETPVAETAAGSSPILIEAVRVERILAQLEARSKALVPYGYGSLRAPAPRKSNNALLAGVLVALWLSSLVLSVAYIRYIGRSPFAADRTAATAPLVIAPESDTQEQKVAASVDHLTKALVKSFERMNRLDAAVQKSKRDLQKIAARVTTDQTVARISVPQTLETETKAPGAGRRNKHPEKLASRSQYQADRRSHSSQEQRWNGGLLVCAPRRRRVTKQSFTHWHQRRWRGRAQPRRRQRLHAHARRGMEERRARHSFFGQLIRPTGVRHKTAVGSARVDQAILCVLATSRELLSVYAREDAKKAKKRGPRRVRKTYFSSKEW